MRPSLPSPGERRVVIVDDHLLFAQTLELALNAQGHAASRLELPEANGSSAALVSSVLRLRPHVLLLDLDLGPHGDGRPVIEPASRAGVDVVVVTGADEPGEWARAILSGARTVLSKAQPLTDVLTTVHRLMRGLPVLSHDERARLIEAWARRRASHTDVWERFDQLTVRESEVLGQLMQGDSVRDIARRGFVAEGTVRTQVKSILAKLGVSSQLAAVGLAYRIGWPAPFDRQVMS